ncbi:N-acetylmuramoyl-L-alanine amidase [Nonomuraea cavernae]|uniref:N-acetylmuramoyl-L-alanine amidase n=1 Tax=Nonomuraea cavernae TaxID=2045107 RepID=A0A917YS45_9ACTN|nr:peptidoglycan recognition family protein [Nonomuraea cavernae]MCA2184938.1 N-acetylmuramoyl-L-alanine amidase [Nonomuraea cavernae]GGO64914.1 amidase [Nonomuraea cavernae]
MRRALTIAVVACLPLVSLTAVTSAARAAEPGDRQQAFAAAAEEFKVPESVLLGVSYLESRWDAHAGQPSNNAGFGPMHLTDAAAYTGSNHHGPDEEDPRGDDGRPAAGPAATPAPAELPASLRTMEKAAELTGETRERLRSDAAANIRGGAALLADHQKALGAPLSDDPGEWYGAVARYSGAEEAEAAKAFADEVYATIEAGEERVTDDGQRVRLAPVPGLGRVEKWLERLGLRHTRRDGVECPPTISCEWIPAGYAELPGGGYGNHDLADRPTSQKIDYIVIHDMEGYFGPSIGLVRDPAYRASWHYSLRSTDGHIAQHIKTRHVGWQAGNWYINAKSVGLEHEGFLAEGHTWYTEAMYRTSAKLVRYLALRHGVPLDRAHIIGHDNVPGTLPSTVRGMHEDPGPFWDWAHYMKLLGAPLHPFGGPNSGSVMIRPDFATNKPYFYGCDRQNPEAACPPLPAHTVWLRTEPHADAPLVKDIGKHPTGESLYSVYDHSARASTGQRFAVADRQGDWTAIWYLGQKAWFHNPAAAPTAIPSTGLVVTPKPGLETVPVYGRAYPEEEAYPEGIPYQAVTPLQYTFAAGEKYTLSGPAAAEYYRAVTFDPAGHTVVRGETRYLQIQFGHRIMFVKADDVRVTLAG